MNLLYIGIFQVMRFFLGGIFAGRVGPSVVRVRAAEGRWWEEGGPRGAALQWVDGGEEDEVV